MDPYETFGELFLLVQTIQNAGSDDQTQSDRSLSDWINALIHLYKSLVFLNKKVLDEKDDLLSAKIILVMGRIKILLDKLCRMESDRKVERLSRMTEEPVKVHKESPANDFDESRERCKYEIALKDMGAKAGPKDPRKVLINEQRIKNCRNLKRHFVSAQFQYSQLVTMLVRNKRLLGLSPKILDEMKNVGKRFLWFVRQMGENQ